MPRLVVYFVIVSVCGASLLAAAPAVAAEERETRDTDAKAVAEAWFASLMSGKTAVTTALSDVPFSFDRKQEVKTLGELRKLFDGIVENKGARDMRPTAVRIEASSPEKVEVVLMIGNEGISVTVRHGEASRVVGFSD